MLTLMHRLWRVMKRAREGREYIFGKVRERLAEGSRETLSVVFDQRAAVLDEVHTCATQGHVPDAQFMALLRTHHDELAVRVAWRNARVAEAHSVLADLNALFPEPEPVPEPVVPPNVHVISSVGAAFKKKGAFHG